MKVRPDSRGRVCLGGIGGFDNVSSYEVTTDGDRLILTPFYEISHDTYQSLKNQRAERNLKLQAIVDMVRR